MTERRECQLVIGGIVLGCAIFWGGIVYACVQVFA